MAITRYAGDRFTTNTSDTKPTGVLDGAYLIDTGNLTQWVRRTVGGSSQWNQLAGGGGGGGTPGGANTQVQFNNAGAFGGNANLTFDGSKLAVNDLALSGIIYDSNNSIGNGGMVLTNEGTTGVNWKSIESVLSGVGGSGVANYVARWSDEDTITSGVIQDDGTAVGINQAADPDNALAIKSIANNTNPLQIAAHDGDSLLVFRQTAGDGRLSIKKDGGVETIRLDSDNVSYITGANFGLGTAAPAAPLDVQSANGSSVGIRVTDGHKMQFLNSSNNTNSNIYNNGASGVAQLDFQIAGATKVTINNDGNVGIGTNTPAAKLDLRSSDSVVAYIIRPSASPTVHIGSATSAGAQLGYVHAHDYAFYGHDAAYNAIVVKSDGNVGIGTTSPDAKLKVDTGNIRLTNDYYVEWGGNKARIGGSTTGDYVFFLTDNTDRMRIVSSGSVGIGTNAPTGKLHIVSSDTNNNLILESTDAAATTAPDLVLYRSSTSAADDDYIGVIRFRGKNDNGTPEDVEYGAITSQIKDSTDGSEDGELALWTMKQGTLTQQVTLNSAGYVGIGTNNPGYPLTVANGTTQARVDLTLQYLNDIDSLTNTDLGRVLFRAPYSGTGNNVGSITLRTGASAYRTDLRFKVKATGGSERQGIIIHGTSNGALVGIGQLTDPTFPFQVSASNLENGPAKRIALFFDETDAAAGTGAGIALGGYVGAGTDPGVSAINDFGVIQGIKENSTLGNYASAMRFLTRQNSANPAEQMRINSEGNVGIGTTAPLGKLHVYGGQVRILDSTASPSYGARLVVGRDTAQDIEFYVDDLNCKIVADQDSDSDGNHNFILDRSFAGNGDNNFQIQKGGSSQFLINTDGNVGINNTSPEHRLHVAGDAIISGYLYDSTNSTGVDGYVLTSKEDGPQWKMIEDVLSGVGGNGTANYIPKWEDEDTLGDSVIAQSGTAIGIGTATPAASLHIAAQAPRIRLEDTLDTSNYSMITADNGQVTVSADEGNAQANSAQIFKVDNNEIMRMNGANVGIGTNAPSGKLHIRESNPGSFAYDSTADTLIVEGNGNAGITIATAAANTSRIIFASPNDATGAEVKYSDATSLMTIGNTNPGDSLALQAGNGAEAVRIVSGGSVGIGTTNPIYTLHVKAAEGIVRTDSTTGTNRSGFQMANTGGTGFIMATSSAGNGVLTTGGLAYALQINKSGGSTDAWNAVQIGTKDIARMTIDESGNVGIGTNNPTGKFQIGANYTIPGTSYGGDDIYIANTGSHSNYDPSVTNTDDFRALITISDGTTTGPTKPGLILYNDDTTAGGFSPMLLFAKRETGASPYKAASAAIYARSPLGTGNSDSWIDGELIFATAGAATQGIRQRMVINKEGLVGIGTNSPDSKLHVLGDTLKLERTNNAPAFKLYNNSASPANDAALGYLQFTGKDNDGTANMVYSEVRGGVQSNTNSAVSGYLAFLTTNNATSVTEQMRIQADGTLDIKYGVVNIGTANSSSAHINSYENMTFNIDTDNDDTNRYFGFYANGASGGGTELVRILEDGNVGIGTTSPSYELHVVGSSYSSVRLGVQALNTSYIATLGGTTNNKLVLTGSTQPFIRFQEGTTDKAYIQWDSSEGLTFRNQEADNFNFIPDGDGSVVLRLQGADHDNWGMFYATENGGAHEVGILDGDGAWAARHVKDTSWDFRVNGVIMQSIASNGAIQFNTYGSGTHTGTAAYRLMVDSSGNVIEGNLGAGVVDGSGTTNYIARWSDTDTIGNSNIFDNGTIGIGTAANLNGKVTIREAGNSGTPNHIFCMLSSAAVGHGAAIFLKTSTSNTNNRYGARIRAIRNDNDNAAADLAFSLENTGATAVEEVVRFTSDGSVGIGTTAPGQKLHVNGSAEIDGSIYLNDTNTRIHEGSGNSVRLQTDSGYVDVGPQNATYCHIQTDRDRFYFNRELVVDSGIIRSYNEDLQFDASYSGAVAKNIIFRTGNVEKMRMDTAGSFGIGTNGPAAKLDVRGNIIRSGLTYSSWTSRSINSITSGSSTINYILIAPKTTTNVRLSGRFNCARGSGVSAVSIAHADIVFCTDNDANPQSGGIHSASSDIPTYGHANFEIVELEYSSTEYYALKISPSSSWVASFNHIEFEGIASSITWTNIDSGNVSNVGAFGGSQAVFAYKHANVGIGTDSPAARLHITSDGSHDEGAEIVLRHANNNSTDVVSTLSFQNNGGQVAMIQAGTTSGNNNGYISFFTDNAGSSGERMRITSNGDVVIGNTTPYNKLHVYGSGRINSLIVGNCAASNVPAAALHIKSSGTDAVLRIEDLDSSNQVFDFLVDQGVGFQIIDKGTGSSTNTRLTIDTNGNVGIGSTQPGVSGLDIAGKLSIGSPNNSFDLYNNGTTYLNGNVTVDATLSVTGGVAGVSVINSSTTDSAAADSYLNIFKTAGSGGGSRATLRVGYDATACFQISRIRNNANIYINSRQSGSAMVFQIQDTEKMNLTSSALTFVSGHQLRWGDSSTYITGSNSSDFLQFYPNGSVQLTLNSSGATIENDLIVDGNIGIGTTTANAKLHVYLTGSAGSFSNIGLFRAGPDSNDSGAEIFVGQQGNSRGLVIRGGRGTGDQALAHFYLNQSGGTIPSATQNHVMTFLQGGYVGIGTTNPGTYKLLVDGTTYIDDTLTVDGDIDLDTMGQYITFYGNSSRDHGITSRNSSGTAADDLRINTYGALFINLDSNGNNTSGADFSIGRHGGTGAISASDWLLDLSGETGKLKLNKYGSGTHTGTAAYQLSVDSSGNIIETTDGGGNVSGGGTNGKIAKWSGANGLTDSSFLSESGTTLTNTATTFKIASASGDGVLQVYGAGGGDDGRVELLNQSGSTAEGFRIRYDNDVGDTYFDNMWAGGSDTNPAIRFRTKTAGTAVNAMTINHAGNVGIGTTGPTYKLDVETASEIVASFVSTDNKAAINISDNDTAVYVSAENSKGSFGFNVGVHANNLNIASSGNVGIGTATPRTNLHVYGTGVDNGLAKVRIGGNTNNTAMLELAETENGSGVMTYGFSMRADGGSGGGSTNDFQIRYHNNSTSGVTGFHMERTDGNIGIGTINTGYKLSVGGNVYISGTLTEASSLAIKENIETFEPSLDIINKIRPVKYDKKKTGKKEIGLIAEELAELFPELVEKDKNGNPSGVNYSRAVTVLLGGFKELYKEVQELKKRI